MTPRKVLLVHTAFIGDVILALPLVQTLRRSLPEAEITFLAVPSAAAALENHPDITRVLGYDKRGADRGPGGIVRLVGAVRAGGFDLALIPHRSLRSALVPFLARVPRRVGFETSAGSMLLTDRVPYRRDAHETRRNLDLLAPLGITLRDAERGRQAVSKGEAGGTPSEPAKASRGGGVEGETLSEAGGRVEGLPRVYPNARDESVVLQWMKQAGLGEHARPVAVAPGSIWKTKRWPADQYAALCRMLKERRGPVVLLGGDDDVSLCSSIAGTSGAVNAAGHLSLLQSAALLKRCSLLVTNDTAPQHLAVAVGTPVVAIFGPTVPGFGFAPLGPHDTVVETSGLACRPCAIHGGNRCPIGTFECMNLITVERVLAAVDRILERTGGTADG